MANDVASVGLAVSEQDVLRLCAELTGLSRALWEVYVRSASSAVEEQEREHREDERQRFDRVVAAVRSPVLPDSRGLLQVSYSPVEESAHRVGRILHGLAGASLTEAIAIAVEVGAELTAVYRAEL